MEDTDYGDNCRIVIESVVVPLERGSGTNGESLEVPCGDRFGGVDSIRRINPQQVEVLLWRVERSI